MKSFFGLFFFTSLLFSIAEIPLPGQAAPEETPPVTFVAPNGTNTVTPLAQAGSLPTLTPDSRISSLNPQDLIEFSTQPAAVQQLIQNGLALTRQNLKYLYGSADPKNGGLDCSGTIYYLLAQYGFKDVPRDASELYKWAWQEGHFQAVVSNKNDTFELKNLQPGDLLFWTGTYKIDRDPPVTHVMIYLGTNRQTGHRVMLGASEGRQFDGKSRYGVSVFDFILSARASDSTTSSRFIGYSPVPHLRDEPSTLPMNPAPTTSTLSSSHPPLFQG